MDMMLLVWLGIIVAAWVLAIFALWALIAGAERQARIERAHLAHPTTQDKGEEIDG